jgi:diacylglycerol kinase family enzyme
MRALLVMNPASTTASPRTREVLRSALDGELKLEVVETERRGHAIELAREARAEGLEVVIALGGDGTVNEVVNGLLAEGPHPDVPHLGVVPGGGANVFARALGIPRDPVEATGALLGALRDGRRRDIGLGRIDERWFTFNAGLGWDAEVVELVDQRRAGSAPTSPTDYLKAALRTFFAGTDRRHAAMTVTAPAAVLPPGGRSAGDVSSGDPEQDEDQAPLLESGLHMVMVANTAPWTYLNSRPIGPFPRASFDRGLDLYALRSLRTLPVLGQVRQVLTRRTEAPRGRSVVARHDLAELTVTASRPVAVQVDGEPLGARDRVVFRAAPAALRVLA